MAQPSTSTWPKVLAQLTSGRALAPGGVLHVLYGGTAPGEGSGRTVEAVRSWLEAYQASAAFLNKWLFNRQLKIH